MLWSEQSWRRCIQRRRQRPREGGGGISVMSRSRLKERQRRPQLDNDGKSGEMGRDLKNESKYVGLGNWSDVEEQVPVRPLARCGT